MNATSKIRDHLGITPVDYSSDAYASGVSTANAHLVLTAGAVGFSGALTGSGIVAVTRWDTTARLAGSIKPGAYVMMGEKSIWAWLRSGVFMSYRYRDSVTTRMPADRLRYPPGGEAIKGVIGQRVIKQ